MVKQKFFTFLMIAFAGFVFIAEPVLAQSLSGTPTTNHRQTSPFGWRQSTNSNHLAIDYGGSTAGRPGDPISSTHGGRVVESRTQINTSTGRGWGNTVVVESPSGNYRTRYSHLDSRGLSTGDTVAPGTRIGAMGDSGSPGSVHLDYAVYVKDPATGQFRAIDPAMAEGRDLDDPAVRAELIADAQGKINGQLRAEGDPQGGNSDVSSTSEGGSSAQVIGCNPALLNGMRQQQQALQQAETEAARALITRPTSVQQLTCFDQYTQLNAERIGRIHANPSSGIGGSIVPNVELPNIQNMMQNFLSGITGGGLQSMLSGAISSLGLGGAGGTSGSAGNCPMMDQMWDLLQCMDFPQMPSLNDIMGGKMNELSGILSGLGSIGNGQGIMGQVCSAVSGLMGGGGSGSTSAYQDAADAMSRDYTGRDDLDGDGNLSVDEGSDSACNYGSLLSTVTNMAADLNGNNIIEASELQAIDTNQDCRITPQEITAFIAVRGQ